MTVSTFPRLHMFLIASITMIIPRSVRSMSGIKVNKIMAKNAPKDGFHIRNKHRTRYDFEFLKSTNPDLVKYVAVNKYGDESIEFSDPLAVTALNKVHITNLFLLPENGLILTHLLLNSPMISVFCSYRNSFDWRMF